MILQIKTGVPARVTEMSLELQDLIKKYSADNYSIYISGHDTPYGIVWVNGNITMILNGIHAMISNVAKDTGKTESEVVKMILSSRPKRT